MNFHRKIIQNLVLANAILIIYARFKRSTPQTNKQYLTIEEYEGLRKNSIFFCTKLKAEKYLFYLFWSLRVHN